jgi:recombination protein RecA
MTAIKKEEKKKIDPLQLAINSINKTYGKGAVLMATAEPMKVPHISTGSKGLNKALGIGGLPKSRVIEIFGPESSGKTTLCLEVIAQAHKNPESKCAYIDAEHALDMEYIKSIGVDLNRLLISQPDCGEDALEICEMLIRTSTLDVVVIDSVAALVPRAEIEGEMGDSHMGLQARLMSQALRKLTALVAQSGTALIFTNQLRQKIGIMFGNPETTTGGNALKFYATCRLDIRRIGGIKGTDEDSDEKTLVGALTRVKVVKNKLAPPFRECIFPITYGIGIDKIAETLDLAVQLNIVDKAGSWYSYGKERIGQGRENSLEFLKSNTEMFTEIEKKVEDKFNGI